MTAIDIRGALGHRRGVLVLLLPVRTGPRSLGKRGINYHPSCFVDIEILPCFPFPLIVIPIDNQYRNEQVSPLWWHIILVWGCQLLVVEESMRRKVRSNLSSSSRWVDEVETESDGH